MSSYLEEQEKVRKLPEVETKLLSFKNLIKNVSSLTGINMTDETPLAKLYSDLECLETMGLKLPNWCYNLFPKGPLLDVILTSLQIANYNDVMKRLHGGELYIIFFIILQKVGNTFL